MGEKIIRTCDHCGADLMQFGEWLGTVGGQRYIRLQEARRDLRVIHTMSTDPPMEFRIFCGKDCLCNWLKRSQHDFRERLSTMRTL